jgi:uncharacterized membrane protein YfcA
MHDVILFLVGIVVGAMNAIAGGGTLLAFPVLLSAGIPAISANATSNIVVLPGNISAAFAYRRQLRKVPHNYLFLLIPTIIGAAMGAFILRHTPPHDFERIVPSLILFAVALFALQPLLYKQLHRYLEHPPQKNNRTKLPRTLGWALLPLAMYGGYFGAGFGFILLAFLGFTGLRAHLHRINALKNVAAVFVNLTSIICLFSGHFIDWRQGLIMASGNLIGGYSGAANAQKVSSHALRIAVIIIGVATATYLGLRSY